MEGRNTEERITITRERYDELLLTEQSYHMKREELLRSPYVNQFDSIIFNVPEGARKEA